jgi:hypothetical protein
MGPRIPGILMKTSRRGYRTTWNPEEGIRELGPDYLESLRRNQGEGIELLGILRKE